MKNTTENKPLTGKSPSEILDEFIAQHGLTGRMIPERVGDWAAVRRLAQEGRRRTAKAEFDAAQQKLAEAAAAETDGDDGQ